MQIGIKKSINNKTLGELLVDRSLLCDHAFVNGQWVSSPNFIVVHNPATGEPITTVPRLEADSACNAISAAERAFPDWRNRLPVERAAVIRKWGVLLESHIEDLALILTFEQGKPLSESRGEIRYAAAFLDWFADEAKRLGATTYAPHLASRQMLVTREPIGVTAAITPWNFPSAMIARKAGAALAAGCTMVVKPAPETPLSALALAVLAERAGVPAGVLSVITGDAAAIGDVFLADARVRKLTFTGSTATGSHLYRQSAATMKRLSMELGGHAPFLVFDDCDLARAAVQTVAAKFVTSGQDCLAANRLLVQSSVAEPFSVHLVKLTEALNVGNGVSDGCDIGPLINESAVNRCHQQIADAVSKGATILTGGKAHPAGKNFFTPTILDRVTPDMRIWREETFGPVIGITRFSDERDAVALANDSVYGLAAYIQTNDAKRSIRVSAALSYGMVGVNTVSFTGAPIPFGGLRMSGLGREGSTAGIEAFTELKYTCFAAA